MLFLIFFREKVKIGTLSKYHRDNITKFFHEINKDSPSSLNEVTICHWLCNRCIFNEISFNYKGEDYAQVYYPYNEVAVIINKGHLEVIKSLSNFDLEKFRHSRIGFRHPEKCPPEHVICRDNHRVHISK